MTGRRRSRTGPKRSLVPHCLVWGGVLVVGVVVGLMAFHALTPVDEDRLVAVDSIGHEHSGNHVHGLGFDEESDRLYVATHFGLFALEDATGPADRLFQVGDLRDDLMGFSLDPHDGERMFASGHPFERSPAGPNNIGVVRSTDGGFQWERVWDGPGGQHVDFHAMALSPVDPQRLVGFFGGQLHVTLDEGGSWDSMDAMGARGYCWGAPCLAWDAAESDRLWLGNDEGLFSRSVEDGPWEHIEEGAHAASYAHPADNSLWSWNASEGLRVSADAGENWQVRTQGLPTPDPEMDLSRAQWVFQMSGAPGDANVLFAATQDGGRIYRTLDGGDSWDRVYPLA